MCRVFITIIFVGTTEREREEKGDDGKMFNGILCVCVSVCVSMVRWKIRLENDKRN